MANADEAAKSHVHVKIGVALMSEIELVQGCLVRSVVALRLHYLMLCIFREVVLMLLEVVVFLIFV